MLFSKLKTTKAPRFKYFWGQMRVKDYLKSRGGFVVGSTLDINQIMHMEGLHSPILTWKPI